MTPASLEKEIQTWVQRSGGTSDDDLTAEMMQTILKLVGDESSRGDLKILNRSLK
ncbi:MAG: hypothetical protein QF619_03110 [Candidatus Binatia bacterium]|nr:hypothetical protein [Candidatus Binatia bacterium]